ncbi:hypothetical protein A7X67_04885 [Clostridium sp. W14A]|nr:hypothetical protein A7X67_04885 [Clostridium sp. W14A]
MRECVKNDFQRNQRNFLILIVINTLLFASIYFMSVYEHNFYGFYHANLPNKQKQMMLIDYSGKFTADQAVPLIHTYQQMKESKLFSMYEMYDQFIEWVHYSGPDKFGDGYEEGHFQGEKSVYQYNGKTYASTSIKSTQLSLNCFSKFSLQTDRGRGFQESDYNLHFGDTVPVLLGHEFAETYKVGDQFKALYLFSLFNFEVVGFLKEDSYIKQNGYGPASYLDRDVILPMFNITDSPKNQDDAFFRTLHYSNKTSCLLEYDSSVTAKEIAEELNRISSSNGLPEYQKYKVTEDGLAQISTNQMYRALSVGKWLVFFVCMGTFILLINRQIKAHLVDYTIYSLFMSYQKISLSLMLEMTACILASTFFTILIILALSKSLMYAGELLLSSGLLIVLLTVYIYFKMQHVDLKKYLVEGEQND